MVFSLNIKDAKSKNCRLSLIKFVKMFAVATNMEGILTMFQKYTKPDIQEAVFDLQIRRGGGFDRNLDEKFSKEIEGFKPHGNVQNINIDMSNVITQKPEVIGYKYISLDQKQIIQFKKNGLSFIRLPIYDGWEVNYEKMLNLWKVYYSVMAPQSITRVAVRFINRFHISGIITLKEYFKSYIQYNTDISRDWQQMSYRLFLSHNGGIKSHIIFDCNVDQNNHNTNVLFDMDIFSDQLVLDPSDNSTLNDIFERLRKVKNDVFEKSITDKIRDKIR